MFQCEKIRKKRSGMLGTIRIAQGNSIDDVDQRIMQARFVGYYLSNVHQKLRRREFLAIIRYLSRLVRKPTMWFPNRSDTKRAVQAQKRARSLKFRI